jgi:hypothetical protein
VGKQLIIRYYCDNGLCRCHLDYESDPEIRHPTGWSSHGGKIFCSQKCLNGYLKELNRQTKVDATITSLKNAMMYAGGIAPKNIPDTSLDGFIEEVLAPNNIHFIYKGESG